MVLNMVCSFSLTHDILLWQHATNAFAHYSGLEFELFPVWAHINTISVDIVIHVSW